MLTKFAHLVDDPVKDMTDYDVTTISPSQKTTEPEKPTPKSMFAGLGEKSRFSSLIAGDLAEKTSDLMGKLITSDGPIEEMLPEEQAEIARQILDNAENPTDARLGWENKLLLATLYDLPLENVMHLEPALIKQLYGESLKTGIANAKLREDTGLIKRLIKGFARGMVVDPARTWLSEGPLGDVDTTIEMVRMFKEDEDFEPEEKPRKFSLAELWQVNKKINKMAEEAKQETRRKAYEFVPGKLFEAPEAATVPEKVTESVAGVMSFFGRLWATSKWFGIPRTDMAGRQLFINSTVVWELENQMAGGTPGKGAAMRLALLGIDKVPANTLIGKSLKLGSESSLFGGLTYAAGGDWVEVTTAALIPLGFRAWNAAGRGVAKQRIKKAVKNLRLDIEKYGIDPTKIPDEALATIINTSKQAVFWNKQYQKGKIGRETHEMRLRQLHDGIRPIMEAIGKATPAKPPPETVTQPPEIPPTQPTPTKQAITKPAPTPVPPVAKAKPLESKQGEAEVKTGETITGEKAQYIKMSRAKGEKYFVEQGYEQQKNKNWWAKGNSYAHYNRVDKTWHITTSQASTEQAVQPAKPKEVWEMTNKQVREAHGAKKGSKEWWTDFHKNQIQEAIKENKPVPRNVLEEYKSERWAKDALAKLEQKIYKKYPTDTGDLYISTSDPQKVDFFFHNPKREFGAINETFKLDTGEIKKLKGLWSSSESTVKELTGIELERYIDKGNTTRFKIKQQEPGKEAPKGKEAPTLAQAAETDEVILRERRDIPQTPRTPVTEQEPTVDLRGKEAQVFNQAVRTQEKITAAEAGEVGIEPVGVSFSDHIDAFHSYQLPASSRIPEITRRMKVVNGRRLSGKITPAEANIRIHKLRKLLIQQAIKEKIALRVSKTGKVKIALRESGVFVPAEVATYKKYKNIEPILGGGQDITRAIQQMDGSLTTKEKKPIKGQAGPIERYVLWRTRKMNTQRINWINEKTLEIQDILTAKIGSKADKEINLVLEKIGIAERDTPIKNVLDKKTFESFSKETIQASQELRQFYDDLIEEQNAARIMRGQEPIPYRRNYTPHVLRDTTVWEQLFMQNKTAKILEKADLPDYIKPNAPFNPRAMAREADIPYDKRILSARELSQNYIRTASRDIFNTSIVQNNKAFIDQLRGQGLEKTANYLSEWTATAYAGIKPALERAMKLPRPAKKAMRIFSAARDLAVFPFNVIWTLGTQVKSIVRTIGKYGTPNTVRGFHRWMKPEIRRRAAKDYYSYIVKSQKYGRVSKQDATNLLDGNIKLQKSYADVIENFGTIFITEMEKILTGTSIEAAYLHGKKRGLRGEALKQYASDGGGKTQEMYNFEDKPMMLNSIHVRTFAPYQTFAIGYVNNLREWAGFTGTPPDSRLYALWSLTRYFAAFAVINMITNRIRRKEWSWWDLAPLPFREFWLSPIVAAITKRWIPGSSGLTSPVETSTRIGKGIVDVLEEGNWRRLRNETIKYGPGLFKIPGGVQWSRMVDGIIAYSNGGLTDRKGKVLFEMKDPEDLARAMFTGVWTTKEAQALLEKRKGKKKKPEPANYKRD